MRKPLGSTCIAIVMRICLVTPAPPRSRKGNRITALRWARLLRQLGHQVTITQAYREQQADLLVALHARRSHSSIMRFRRKHPDFPLIVALTGTDLYQDIRHSRKAVESLELATRIILLQPLGMAELPRRLHAKTRIIYQSAVGPRSTARPRKNVYEVCVLGHLRPVKDPFRAARAARQLAASSRIRILQIGAALSPAMARWARAEAAANPRYRWLGELAQSQALRVLARCRLLVLTSKSEGGANVISEALAASVPVVSSRIAGSIGILGPDYPGYFPVGDTRALADLMLRVETDSAFRQKLQTHCQRKRALVEPSKERESWRRLLRELRVVE